MGDAEVEAFLDHLVLKRQVAAGTQAIVLNTLCFLYKDVIGRPLSVDLNFVKSQRPRKLPVVLTHEEINRFFVAIRADYYLAAALMYGSGLRLMEAVRLRVKDIDFDYCFIRVWIGIVCVRRTVELCSDITAGIL